MLGGRLDPWLSMDVCATFLALLTPCSGHAGASFWLFILFNVPQPLGEGVLFL